MRKLILFGTPLIVLIEILIVNSIFELLRQPSDVAVLAGVFSVCLFAFLNYLLIKFIFKQFKTK